MNITIRQLQIFESVAEHLSYTRAAKFLYLTQPAVSMQIKQLESEITMPLFERIGRSLFLTEVGRELLVHAQNISQQLSEITLVINELGGSHRGTLNMAVATTAIAFSLKLLGEFYKRFSGANITLDVTNRASLLSHLENNTIDMAIMGQPPDGLDVEAISFMENPIVVVAPSDHGLVGKKDIPLKVLQEETFIMREPGSGTRIAMERFFDESGYSITSVMEMSSNEAINQAVESGLGLGIVSRNTLELQLSLGALVILDVESFPMIRHWYLVHRKGKNFTVLMSAFKRMIQDESSNILS